MAGVHFTFDNFKELLNLYIGIADRLDENRAESFTILYCNLKNIKQEVIDASLTEILRTSDSIVNDKKDYFFILPYTDKYGAEIVKKMFDTYFNDFTESFLLSYPADGETPEVLLGSMQDSVSVFFKDDLSCLNRFAKII